jgi:hypothetical protein
MFTSPLKSGVAVGLAMKKSVVARPSTFEVKLPPFTTKLAAAVLAGDRVRKEATGT